MYFANILNLHQILKGEVLLVPENIQSKSELINIFCNGLMFPYYFGGNWDALYDCLVDLHWIKEKAIFIVHKDFPLDNSEFDGTLYVRLLADVLLFWDNAKDHEVTIFFNEKYKIRVDEILKLDRNLD